MIELFFNFILSFFHSFILWSFLSLNFSGIIAAVNQGCNYPLLSFFLSFILVLLYYKSVQNRSGGATMDSGSYLYQNILVGVLQRLSILFFMHIYRYLHIAGVYHIYEFHAYHIVTVYRSAICQWQGYSVPVQQHITYNLLHHYWPIAVGCLAIP